MKISKTIKDLTNRANQLAFPDQTQEDRYFNYISISIAVDQTFDTFQGFSTSGIRIMDTMAISLVVLSSLKW